MTTFRSSVVPSVNFSQLSVRPWDLLSAFGASKRPSVNFLCVRGIFHQLSVQPRDIPSTFCAAAGPTINFSQISIPPWGLRSTFRAAAGFSVNFCACAGTSVDFRQLMCSRGTFRQLSMFPQGLSSAFRMAVGLPVKFRQLSVHPWDLLSTSVNFPCVHSTFHQLLSTFCAPAGSSVNNLPGCRIYCQHQSILRASARLTVNLRQLFVRPGDLLSTFRLAG